MARTKETFRDLKFEDPAKEAMVAEKVMEALGKQNASDWDTDNIKM